LTSDRALGAVAVAGAQERHDSTVDVRRGWRLKSHMVLFFDERGRLFQGEFLPSGRFSGLLYNYTAQR
jgi:hypothetical protein